MRTQTETTVPSKLNPDLGVQDGDGDGDGGAGFHLQSRRQSQSTGRDVLDLALKVFAVDGQLNRGRDHITIVFAPIFRASQTEDILKQSDHAELVRLAHDRVARAEYTLIFGGRSTA